MLRPSWSRSLGVCVAILSVSTASTSASGGPQTAADPWQPVPIPISHLFNSKATSVAGENDGVAFRNGSTFPSEYLPTGEWSHDGVPFVFPEDWQATKYDNIAVGGQKLELPEPIELTTIHLIGAGQDPNGFLKSETTEALGLTYDGGATLQAGFVVRNWWCIHNANKGAIRAPFNYFPDGSRNWNASHLFHMFVDVPPSAAGRTLQSITFPHYAEWNNLHVFALTITPAALAAPTQLKDKVAVREVKATRRWVDSQYGPMGRAQVVEVTVTNPQSLSHYSDPSAWLDNTVLIALESSAYRTIEPARLHRLMPGDERTLEVLIVPAASSKKHEGSLADLHTRIAFVSPSTHRTWRQSVSVTGAKLVHNHEWTEAITDLEQHSAPSWFKQAKFGIFIHWGLFAVPAFGPPKQYAEWYDWWLHSDAPGGPTYQHHLDTYGADFVYDDFIPQFTGANFNASEWVNFFADAGARYFVLTTKHHDGFALFDTKETSHRNSVRLGPKRDFLRQLMDAAEAERPALKRGTYFSMPEWFNPLYHKYGKVTFPGGLAHSPFDGSQEEAYTGFIDVPDYVEDLQLAQMKILANEYKTDMMWCDIGLANHSSNFAAEWYTSTSEQGRQVTMNDRCGMGGDFNTPEMTQFGHVERETWESCMGMDPYSFGYNKDTPVDAYRSAENVIHTLVDIVAKGGNLLLNVGPNAEGVIVEAMTRPLLEAGRWLEVHGEAIYDTEPFILSPEYRSPDGEVDLRFTRGVSSGHLHDTLYITSLKPLPSRLDIAIPLPVIEGDEIMLLSTHGDGSGTHERHLIVPWTREQGVLSIDLADIDLPAAGIAWVLKVSSSRTAQTQSIHIDNEL